MHKLELIRVFFDHMDLDFIPEFARDRLATIPEGVLHCLVSYKQSLARVVSKWPHVGWPKFMGLAQYLAFDWDGVTYKQRAQVLIDYNQQFQKQDWSIERKHFARLRILLGDMGCLGLSRELDSLRTVLNAEGITYLLDRHGEAIYGITVLKMIAACQCTDGKPGLIRVEDTRSLETFFLHNARRFYGFDGWGNANNDSPGDNIAEHCMKHLFYNFPEGHTAPPIEEMSFWWNKLEITLQLFEVLDCIGESHLGRLDPCLRKLFGDTYRANAKFIYFDPKQPEQVRMLGFLCKYTTLSNQLIRKYSVKYANFAVGLSRTMRNVQVHLTNGICCISGTNDNVFIVGRIGNGIASISSAYWVQDPRIKVNAHTKERLWAYVPD